MWPVYLVILNLPPKVRMNANNIILAGIWAGRSKPPMKLLLDPVLKVLRQLSTIGISISMPSGQQTIRAKLIMGVFDLPAKASVLCMKQFNGESGCSVCYHPGQRLSNCARVYLPKLPAYHERTHTEWLSAATRAQVTGQVVGGIMGRSPLLSSNFDLVASIPIDYMHAVLEGVVRRLVNMWINSIHHLQPYYIGRKIATIDNQLLQQRPPSEFSRPPRSIHKHLKFWKASEFRNWLLFYSLPLLLHVLPPPVLAPLLSFGMCIAYPSTRRDNSCTN